MRHWVMCLLEKAYIKLAEKDFSAIKGHIGIMIIDRRQARVKKCGD